MSKKCSRKEALDNISTWDTEEVLSLLRKNELEECCKAVAKRQIDGDELLHLTDGKLVLWKSDLTRSLIGQLWAFVQELNKSPENYVSDKITEAERIQSDDHLNNFDTSSWGSSEFEDEMIEESRPNTQSVMKPSLVKNKQALFLQNNKTLPGSNTPTYTPKQTVEQEMEEIYVNCENLAIQDTEGNMYTNCEEAKSPPLKNISKLHSQIENSLANKLKEELEGLKRRNQDQAMKKPVIGPKPEMLSRKIPMTVADKKLPQKSFLHDAPKMHQRVPPPNAPIEQNKTQKRMAVPPPPKPKNNKDTSVKSKKTIEKELPKLPPPPNFDLIANLPAQMEGESEDEYESFDENIIKQVQQMSRVNSKQSLHSGRQGSVESVYKPPSSTSHEEEQDYEIYTSITEAPDDDGYESPIQRISETQQKPPPLPAKPSPPSTLPNRTQPKEKAKGKRDEFAIMATIISDTKRNMSLNMTVRRQANLSECLTQATLTQARLNLAKRSPDKKSPTISLPSYNASLSTERATRPLPPPPERNSYVDKPWFHNITREQAATLIRDSRTYNNPQDGYFLLRPSTTNPGNPLALVLWYKDRVYNVPVRKRNDNRYALGSVKVNELSFSTVEDIVIFYSKEELMLYSGGIPTGSTKLTDTPPKQF